MVAERGLRSDAARGGLPKPTDDSLTGFLQASPDRLKLGSMHAKMRIPRARSEMGLVHVAQL